MGNKRLVIDSLVVGIYVALSIALNSISYGFIQIRIAELLVVLCLYDKRFIISMTLGCFLTNIIGVFMGADPLVIDIVVGTLATLISSILVYEFRNILLFNKPLLSLMMPVIINGVMVGLELSLFFTINVGLLMLYVAIGEFISVFVLGLFLYKPIINAVKSQLQ